jgi:hypothetical protein
VRLVRPTLHQIEKNRRLAGMVGSLSFGRWFRAMRHGIKAAEGR